MIKKNNWNVKRLRNYLDVFINETLNYGVLTYQLTINFSDFESFSEEIDQNKYISELKETIKELEKTIDKIKLISYLYVSNELNKNSRPHVHIIIGIKSILGYNDLMENNLLKFFLEECYSDIKIDLLKNFIDIKNFFNYILKDIDNSIINHNFILYDPKLENTFNSIDDIITSENYKILCGYKPNEYYNYPGIKKQNDNYNEYTIINLINFYFIYNNYYWNNDTIYEKINNKLISFKKLTTFKELINNIDEIYNKLEQQFPIQLRNLDVYSLKLKFLKNIWIYINEPNNIFVNYIFLTFDLLEFKDGIYSIKYNIFLTKNKAFKTLQTLKYNLGTLKNYELTYKHTKEKEPIFWLTELKKTLKNENELNNFLIYFISIFHKDINLLGKKRILYIYGEPNTKKTTLSAKILINFYGIENVGFLSKNKNFLFENLINKEIAVFDEFEHNELPVDIILKMFEGSDVVVDQKFKEPILLKRINILIISNKTVQENKKIDPLTKKAIEARIQYTQFTNTELLLDPEETIHNKLKQEEPYIILYCNKKLNMYKKSNTIKLINSILKQELE